MQHERELTFLKMCQKKVFSDKFAFVRNSAVCDNERRQNSDSQKRHLVIFALQVLCSPLILNGGSDSKDHNPHVSAFEQKGNGVRVTKCTVVEKDCLEKQGHFRSCCTSLLKNCLNFCDPNRWYLFWPNIQHLYSTIIWLNCLIFTILKHTDWMAKKKMI